MRKLIWVGTLVLPLLGFCADRAGSENSLNDSLQGTWELVSAKVSCMPEDPGVFPKERRKFKLITGKQFLWVDYERASGKVLSMAGGCFELKGSQYLETIQFATQEVEGLVGKTFTFEVKVQRERLIQAGNMGEELRLEETWTRATEQKTTAFISQVRARPAN